MHPISHAGRLVARLLLPLVLASTAEAEIYQYKDADGVWQFSDAPPGENQPSASIKPPAPVAPRTFERDLAAKLEKALPTRTPLERAALAVVSVQSSVALGSGFFITGDGLLLTNRHVIKSIGEESWRPRQEKLEQEERNLATARRDFDAVERNIRQIKVRIAQARAHVDSPSASVREQAKERIERLQMEYSQSKPRLDEVERSLKKRERDLDKQRRDLRWDMAASEVERSFPVTAKDGTRLMAALVSVSENHDLALLRVSNTRTPLLQPASGLALSQGQPVFAIGNALGMGNAITSGIVTSIRGGLLTTDALVLPGNSGGPLLNEHGEVIGINVSKLTGGGSPHDQGFGKAIPIATAIRAFSELRTALGTRFQAPKRTCMDLPPIMRPFDCRP